MATDRYGKYYWCVKTTTDVSQDGEILVMADRAIVTSQGALEFLHYKDDEPVTNLAIAPGRWLAYYAASVWDGSPVAVEHWKGEVNGLGFSESNETTPAKERGKINNSLRYDVLKRDNFKCRKCGAMADKDSLEVDHIIPISKGGQTNLANLQTLCRTCNSGKSDKQ